MDKYLIKVEGQGDTEIILVDKEMWDWLWTDAPAKLFTSKAHCCMDDTAPESLKEIIKKGEEAVNSSLDEADEDRLQGKVRLSRGAWRNDRALAIILAFGNSDQEEFWMSIKGLVDYCKEHDINIIDEWEGCIY